MKNSRHLILVFCGLLLFSCTGNKYIVERTPKHNNPVDEISWLKERKKEFDKNTTVVYDQEGNICLKFGGLMPPPKREAVKKFFENAENKGTIWKCKQRHKKE